MPKKKKTLAQQYDEQVRRIEKRLKQLAAEGYDVVSEWDSTKRPKRPTRQQVEALKKVTPAKLRKRAVNNTIAVGKRVTHTPVKSTREKVARKEAARKKAEAEAIAEYFSGKKPTIDTSGSATAVPYLIKVANVAEGDVLNIRKEPNANSDKTGYLQWNDTKKYTIVEEKNGWGRLKSEIGWINLKYTVKA